MRTIKRIYFYMTAFISLVLSLWGVIGMLNTLVVDVLPGNEEVSDIAVGLAMMAIGFPAFGLHWYLLQRDALRDPAERGARLRALFFYLSRIVILLPIVHNIMGLINRPLFGMFEASE